MTLNMAILLWLSVIEVENRCGDCSEMLELYRDLACQALTS